MVPINGWQMRPSVDGVGGATCSSCGQRGVLYQGRRHGAGGWRDLPDALLCDPCRQQRFDVQRQQQDVPPPRPWWKRW